jgi:uncharacterized protein (DUF362 family)
MTLPSVILRKCDTYDVANIRRIIHESLDELGLSPTGRTFIKPNIVSANKRYIHDSFTHPAVVEAMVQVLRERKTSDITIGESGGYGIPTRLFFRESGHREMAERIGVDLIDLNEHPVTKTTLEKAAWHKSILLSNYIRDAQWKIWMPKLKFHIFASITNALKLNIGILTHKERMLYHDYRIHEKIVDLLEPGTPNLIVSDAVRITYGFESAPYPVDLGLLMIADQPLAADVVAAHIMGYDPKAVEHLKIAADRGYGSLDLENIRISGDASLEELRAKPKGNHRLFQHLSELDTPIRFFAGCAPGTTTICDGGCEGAVKGALGTIEKRSPGALKGARTGAIVTGMYDGDVIVPDGPVLMIGDCTTVSGTLEAKKVHRVKGCPIGARDLFIKVPLLFHMPSPMLDPRDASLFIMDNVGKALSILKNRAFR